MEEKIPEKGRTGEVVGVLLQKEKEKERKKRKIGNITYKHYVDGTFCTLS